MGNRQAPAPSPMSPLPRSFFLVIGKPPIRYTGDPARGPLLFDVELEAPEVDGNVDHAETLEMPVAVPSQQSFRLFQAIPSNWRCGALLSFSLSMTRPGQSLRVLAGVDVRYCEGEGLRLVQSERSQSPFCVFEFTGQGNFPDYVETIEPLQVRRLRPAQVTTDVITGVCRLSYAPIAIVLTYETVMGVSPSSPLESRVSRSSPTHSSPTRGAPSERVRGNTTEIVQYTFLDIPRQLFDRVRQQMTVPEQAEASAEGALRQVFKTKVVRQMLQRGCEVYELDNVFDVGAWTEQASDEEGDEENEAALCVICMSNQKDTTLLPCRHMCLCYECAALLRFQQNNRCPICRAAIKRVLTV